MNDILNPYIAGAPVTEASMFFGREDIFSWIERSLGGKYVDHILVLHGQRRVGKTSVLKQIPNFLPNKYIQVFFDLQGRTSTSLDRFLWWLASEIARTLKKERDLDISRPDRKAFEDTETLINEFLPALRPLLGDQVLLLTFDEFDTLDRPEIQESLALPLIAYLRRLMETEGLNFVFSIGSSGDKLENMQASYTDFFKSALYRKISFLTRDDCHRLITKPVEGTIQYERKAVDRIVEITSGHPYFTQLMCHELFALCQKTEARTITAADVESVLGDVIERGTVNLKFVWDEASDLEKWILAGLAQLEGGATSQKLSQLLQAQRVRFSESDLNSAVIHLRDKDVITQDNRFIIHLMRMWLQANRPLDRVREELVEVNPIANRYIEIGDEYRDMGQSVQAIESYQQAIQADPGNLKAQSSIANVYLEKRAFAEAASAFELAMQIDDEDVAARTGFCDANLALGDAARKTNEIETAIGFYEKILVVNPAHADARLRLAKIYRERAEETLSAGQDEAALSAFNRAMDYVPEDDALAARYDEVLAQKKAKVVAEWMGKAERALTRQRWDEAAGFAEQAIKLDPENPDLQAKLVEVKDAPRQFKIQGYRREAEQAIKRGQFEKAISALETAVLLDPEDQSLAEWLDSTRSDQLNAQLNIFRDQARHAIAEGDWNAAIAAYKEALKLSPDNVGLQKELADTESAKLQAQLSALKIQAETAIRGLDWDGAVNAYKQAAKLAPEDPTWLEKIKQTEADKLKAQLDTFQKQADEAVSQGKWEDAVQAVKDAAKIAPDAVPWKEKLAEIENARHQAQLKAFRQEADTARSAGNWDAAIAALEGYLKLEPGEAGIHAEIEAIRVEKRQSQLDEFKTQAEKSAKAENWAEAVAAWEKYLALEPGDREKVEAALQHALKYAKISGDYAEAQAAIRKKRYGRAIELLQTIIAQDPTYKSTSRLLVEAVEANKTIPVWRRPWVLPALGSVVVIVLGVIFGPRLWENISSASRQTPTTEHTLWPAPSLPSDLAFLKPVLDYMAETPPDIEDDFSRVNPLWEKWLAEGIQFADGLKDGTLHLEIEAGTPREKLVLQSRSMTGLGNFGLEYDFLSEGSASGTILGVGFESLIDGTNGHVDIDLTNQTWFIGLTNDSLESSGEIEESLKGQWAHLQMFFIDGYLVGFLNGKFLGHAEGIETLRQNVWLYTVTGGQATIQIDNFEFWNLEEVALQLPAAEPTLTPPPTATAQPLPTEETSTFLQIRVWDYINVTNPDFEEDFSTPQSYWTSTPVNSSKMDTIADRVMDGVFRFSEVVEGLSDESYSSEQMRGADFALQFDWTLNSSGNSILWIPFPIGGENQYVFSVGLDDQGWWEFDLDVTQNGTSSQEILEQGKLEINPGQTYSFQVLAWQGQLAIFVDYQLLTSFEGLEPFTSEYPIPISSQPGLGGSIDNIQFWNLGTTFTAIRNASDFIQSEAPTYQTSFDTWEFGEPIGNVSIEDGKLVAISENIEEISRITFSSLSSDRYAVEYEFRILEPDTAEGQCDFNSLNHDDMGTESWRIIGASFILPNLTNLAVYEYPDQWIRLAEVETTLDFSETNTVRLIVLGDQITAFLNGNLVYSVQNPVGSAIYTLQGFSAAFQIGCEFDNYKIWDLSGVDFGTAAPEDSNLYFHLGFEAGEITSLDWSSDGKYLAFTGKQGNLTTLNTQTKSRKINAPSTGISTIAWFPGTEWIATSTGNGRIESFAHAASSGDSFKLNLLAKDLLLEGWGQPEDLGPVTNFRFTSDGKKAAACTEKGFVATWSVPENPADGWTLIRRFKYDIPAIYDLAWNPEGTQLLINAEGSVYLLNATTLSPIKAWNYTSLSGDWSPDGAYIAVGNNNPGGASYQLDVLDLEGALLASGDIPGIINQVVWSPDGSQIATASTDGIVRIWSWSENSGLEEVLAFDIENEATDVAWSPDGKMLAAGDANGSIWVWDLSEADTIASTQSELTTAFYEPILAYIESKNPTFEDDFSAPDMVWGGNSGGYAIYAMVKDGVLIMHDRGTREDSIPDVPGEIFPTNGLLNASDFALQFDFVFETDNAVNSVAVQFRSYELFFDRNGAWTLYKNGDSSQTVMDSGSEYLKPSKNTLLIIVYNQNLAIYLNNTLLFVSNEIALTGIENRIIVTGDYETYMEFDNVKFWNLDGVDF